MAIQTIGYANKVTLNDNTDVADVNKVKADDMNEIKSVVNNNANEFINKLPVTLFENQSGSYSNIVLNDSAANYSKLYIETKGLQYTDYIKDGFLVIDNPNGKTVSTSNTFYNFSNNQIYVVDTIFTISGTSITISGNQAGTVGAASAYGGNGNCLGITKVLGYK